MQPQQDLTKGVIYKQVLFFFFPIVVGSFLLHFYSIVDGIIVGRGLGDLEFAAVSGSASKIIALIINFFIGISIGITVYASRYYGKKDFIMLKGIITNGLLLFILIGLILSGLCIIFSMPYLKIMGTPENTIDYAQTYMNTYLSGMVFCVIYNVLAGIFRALGDAITPLYILVFSSILNIFLSIFMALILNWGVMGVALATVISEGISAIFLGKILYNRLKYKGKYHFHIDILLLKEIALMGIPSGIQSMMFSFSNMAIQSAVNSFHAIAVSGWGAYLKVDAIVDSFLTSLANTVIPFIGQNIGIGKINRIKEIMRTVMVVSYTIITIISILFLLFRFQIIYLFTNKSDIVEIGVSVMWIILPMYILSIPQRIYSTAIRGFGKSMTPMWLNLIGVVGFRFFWIYFILPLNHSILTLALCYPVSSLLMSIIFTIYYKRELHILERKFLSNSKS